MYEGYFNDRPPNPKACIRIVKLLILCQKT